MTNPTLYWLLIAGKDIKIGEITDEMKPIELKSLILNYLEWV